jgi:hypothetical protein
MNTGTRITDVIETEQASNLLAAVKFAWLIDHPLNLAININLDLAAVDDRPQDFVTGFLKPIVQWLRTKGEKAYYIWVLENPPQGSLNVHILLYWPPQSRKGLGARLRKWLKLSGGRSRARVLDVKILRQPGEDWVGRPYGRNTGDFKYARYLLKGADPDFCRQWENVPCLNQGPIEGKRSGMSQTLGVTARARDDFFSLVPSSIFERAYRLYPRQVRPDRRRHEAATM